MTSDESTRYVLESDPETALWLPADMVDRVLDLLEAFRDDPSVGRDMLQLGEEFRHPAFARRALDLVEIYEDARARGIGPGPDLARFERRRGAPTYRDYLVLAFCRKGLFDRTHDPSVRGAALARAFEADEAAAPVLDRLDSALFRVRFARDRGMRILGDAEWGAAMERE